MNDQFDHENMGMYEDNETYTETNDGIYDNDIYIQTVEVLDVLLQDNRGHGEATLLIGMGKTTKSFMKG